MLEIQSHKLTAIILIVSITFGGFLIVVTLVFFISSQWFRIIGFRFMMR
jgi:hypothetical protein